MADYNFLTIWRFPQPIARVWEAINAAEDYPRWWPNIVSYRCLTPNNPRGVGAQGERIVRGFLPYSLRYTTIITKSDPPRELAYDAAGDLVGSGRFVLCESAGQTEVTIYWQVSTRRPLVESPGAPLEVVVRRQSQCCDAPRPARIGGMVEALLNHKRR